jgi:aspartate carbamoyltransferase regulatory subunit
MDRDIRVRKIRNGTVIDHIPGGQALNVLKIIGIPEEYPMTTVTVAMNVPSKVGKVKDIVKVEGRELKDEEVDKIALIAPAATINIIRDYQVVEKKMVSLPERARGVIRCANPSCITNAEEATTEFIIEHNGQIRLRCKYCERTMGEQDIVKQF